MESDSFCKLSCKPCRRFDDWTQMTSFSQIVRLYRVSERPNPGQKETKGKCLVMCLYFSQTHWWVSRVASHETALNIGIIVLTLNLKQHSLKKKWYTPTPDPRPPVLLTPHIYTTKKHLRNKFYVLSTFVFFFFTFCQIIVLPSLK